jgi:hypothetical protein
MQRTAILASVVLAVTFSVFCSSQVIAQPCEGDQCARPETTQGAMGGGERQGAMGGGERQGR